ncbi:MAG: DNA-binding protein [Actinobacteria bacterium]|jgi:predicted DNA-binding protein with PD1-like motif|nr:DNA-binding protein [Actinomycetota bacterium]
MYDVQASIGPAHILKPPFGSDLLEELQKYVLAKNINLAWLSGVGAVSRANIRYYDQPKREWIDIRLDKRLEVAGMWGNVSLLNGEPIVHVHIALADEQGVCYGGHLADGTVVFNLEILMTTLTGPPVIRKMDGETGLTIWH